LRLRKSDGKTRLRRDWSDTLEQDGCNSPQAVHHTAGAYYEGERSSSDHPVNAYGIDTPPQRGIITFNGDLMNTYDIVKSCRRLHFIGIGGVSMSSLAAVSQNHGYEVSGSDMNDSLVIRRLRSRGITIFSGHEASNVDDVDAVIYTAAVDGTNPELARAAERGIPCITRAQYLGGIMQDYSHRIGVSGTHGKSSTTSMLTSIFLAANANPTIFCGAETEGLDGTFRVGSTKWFIYESCEHKDSFLQFSPTTSVILNIDLDHVDYFADTGALVKSFAKSIEGADIAVANWDDENVRRATEKFGGKVIKISVSGHPDADYAAENITYERGMGAFDWLCRGEYIGRVQLAIPGQHNIYNAMCAIATAHSLGLISADIIRGIEAFRGTKRRFERKGELITTSGAVDIFDDYAHHPVEIEATLQAAAKLGYSKVWCIYQPHTYSRTKHLGAEMVEALRLADEVILTDIYAARETPIEGVSSHNLAADLPGARVISSFADIAEYIRQNARAGEMVITVGAGDVVKVADMLV